MVAPSAQATAPNPSPVDGHHLARTNIQAPIADALLADILSPHHSLASAAARHNIPLEAVTLWLALPETRARLAAMDEAGSRHVQTLATLNLSASVHTLVQIMADFRALAATRSSEAAPGDALALGASPPEPSPPAPIQAPDDATYLRASIHARKAAWLLYQLSRSGSPSRRTHAPAHRTASVSERIPSVNAVSRAADPLRVDAPQRTHAPTHRTASVSERIPSAPAPHTSEPPAPSGAPTAPPSPSSPWPSPPLTYGGVIEALETYAASVGLCLDDIEGISLDGIPEDADFPEAALAGFPPEILAILSRSSQPPDPPPDLSSDPPPHPPPTHVRERARAPEPLCASP